MHDESDFSHESLDATREHFNSLPRMYREALIKLLTYDDADLDVYLSGENLTDESFEQICQLATDVLILLDETSTGAAICRLTEAHRHVIRLVLVEQMQLHVVADDLGIDVDVVRACEIEAREFLIPGALDLVQGILALNGLHRRVFVGILLEGIAPAELAEINGRPKHLIDAAWRESLDIVRRQAADQGAAVDG